MSLIDLDAPLAARRRPPRQPRALLLVPAALLTLALPGEVVPAAPVVADDVCAWTAEPGNTSGGAAVLDPETGAVLMTYLCNPPA
jgi:hypothetical protein